MSVGLQEYAVTEIPVNVFAPVGLAERPTVDRLQARAASAVEDIFSLLTDMSLQLASCPSAAQFQEYRKKVYPEYLDLMTALGSIIRAKLDPVDLPSLIDASLNQIETQFQESRFYNEQTRSEILFCISTLRGALRWIPYLQTNKLEGEKRDADRELARHYTGNATWCQFHLAALGVAENDHVSLAPEVLSELLEGLRASVMAYSYVRQALDLRDALEDRYKDEITISWDEEDEALANSV